MNKTTNPTPADLTEHTGHTPGPWQVISPALGHTDFGIWGPQGKPIGNVVGRSYTDNLLNACLIAAAPELLEALKLSYAYVESLSMDDEAAERDCKQIRAAIARAEGKPTLQ